MEAGRTFLWVFLNMAGTVSQNDGHCALSVAYKYLAPRLLMNPGFALELFFPGSLSFVVLFCSSIVDSKVQEGLTVIKLCYLGEL